MRISYVIELSKILTSMFTLDVQIDLGSCSHLGLATAYSLARDSVDGSGIVLQDARSRV
jgi:hypothetical protein